MLNKYLDGENIKPNCNSSARKLISKKVRFLRGIDIDKSGRGYFFPKTGVITDVFGRNICIDGDYIGFSEIVEMQDLSI